ncbi:DsbC/DsbD-like thiol-disulfide interchange protein/cytochrome c biogenesis protein CcdA [Novosphingobium chloroacetimidivorans]|uniref:DsbC/DsbD-like thiol-disulfide interchange protein/cytochrome c biogenesis protein CcdA n=1 Tax=Novosphingobium chloroacetimidivorans TaxID=1428314 RepID=A0A7W7K7L6_9SPHN|nr:protein-disulfide reductase DsbD domain-containing protein [Novosphingobium chloroacetimidivorans]MBB4857651.1 DsbC/DsbD-like thiol-disulfide interchange protein/cytochrome c biogenesis protein CcdA [Novosphingobium chloroacetimidivorans]
MNRSALRRSSLGRRYALLVAVLWQALALLLLPSAAQAAPNHIAAELVAGPSAPGSGTQLAIRMRPEPGWHGYWRNPGDAGLGMQLDWSLPEGAKAGEPQYPVPQTLLVSGLMNHVYEKEYAVLVPFSVPAGAKAGMKLPVRVKAQWLACTEQLCVPESAELAVEITVGAQAHAREFEEWTRRLPAPLGSRARFALEPTAVRFAIPLPATAPLAAPHLFVVQDKLVDYAAPQQFTRQGDTLLVTIPRAKFAPASPSTVDAVLRLDGEGSGIALSAAPGAVPMGGTPLSGPGTSELPALPWLLLGALVGGLLLNVMPCVFPILSLKAISLARAGESEAHARVEGLAYTAGVVLACLGLGAVLLGLRATGEQVGWAFQLQEPAVIAALLLLACAITANLLGLFEFAVPGFASSGSPQGAFATGLLAAFVATPCTGPFMATAMGAALLLPILPALALFAALGVGIALPFLAIAFVPALRRRMPRPGAWMNTFRRWMAVPMGLTALALAWLASRIAGPWFALAAVVLAVLLVALLALAGRRQRQGQAAIRPTGAGLVVLGAMAVVVLPLTERAPSAASASMLAVRPFSEAALAKARASGKPVFAWFTADWCLTCKVNEEVAIEREETRAAFEKAGVVVLRGDWTRRDPAITRYLTAQGAAGVPLYVWYPAGSGTPEKLPQVLTPSTLADKACAGGACR